MQPDVEVYDMSICDDIYSEEGREASTQGPLRPLHTGGVT